MAESAPKLTGRPGSDFIRQLPPDLTIDEMLTATNAAGFPLSKARVYQIRHDENLGFKAAVGGPKKKTRATKKKRKYPRRVTAREAIAAIAPKAQPPSVDAKEQLRRIAMRIGLIRLAELMREIEAEVGM